MYINYEFNKNFDVILNGSLVLDLVIKFNKILLKKYGWWLDL